MFLDWLFPRFCLGCGQEGSAWCSVCAASFVPERPRPRCPFCEVEGSSRTCFGCRQETYLDGLTAIAPYGNQVIRQALTSWKYDADPQMGEAVGLWIRQFFLPRPGFGISDTGSRNRQVITHLPLHISRRRHRGFDQAEQIAAALSRETRLDHETLLVRIKATASQAKRSHQARLVGDLDGIFQPAGPVPDSVILCDDVFTSGATMDAAAKALKDAGAKSVWGFAVARG
jgi:ComF family protein